MGVRIHADATSGATFGILWRNDYPWPGVS